MLKMTSLISRFKSFWVTLVIIGLAIDMSWGAKTLLPHWSPSGLQKGLRGSFSPSGVESRGLYPGPYFDKTPKTVSVQVGSQAYLMCRVKQLDDKSVSWVRRSDSSILSVGNSTFIQDSRFRVIHSQDSEVWGLQISSTKLSDAGPYECQISTEPKRSWVVELKVVESSVKIIGSPDIFVQSGTSVDIKCQISEPGSPDNRVQRVQQAYPPTESVVFWFRDGRRILPSEDGLSPITSDRLHQDVLVQALRIQSAKRSDAGNYTCALPDGSSDTVILHVLNGENSQAMHDMNGAFNSRHGSKWAAIFIPCALVFLAQQFNWLKR